jgi:uncharacterized membrane protein YgaE (UPF0421/DUF939 family)
LRRGVRVGVVAPLVFAFLLEVVDSPAAAIYGSFGAFALLGFADFGGRTWPRAWAYTVLALVSAALVALGSALSTNAWAAAAVMLVVATVIRFVGCFGGRYAASVSPAILGYVLGATIPAAASEIPGRVGGWLLGGAAAVVAATVLLPRREHLVVRRAAATACEVLADSLDSVARDPTVDVRARVDDALRGMRQAVATDRRSGPSTHDLALTFMLDELRLISLLVMRPNPFGAEAGGREVAGRTATELRVTASELRGRAIETPDALEAARIAARDESMAAVTAALSRHDSPDTVLAAVESTYVERLLLYLATSARANAGVLLGHDPGDVPVAGLLALEYPTVASGATLSRAVDVVRANAVPRSAWLQDSLRAGIALGVAVLVADLASLDHAFWVVLGTLAVLRSSAFETGRTGLDAAMGTVVGFVVSTAFFAVVGLDRTALWIVIVLAYFLAAYLPQVAGFVAGQAAFTVLVVCLFNLVVPAGWQTGLVRVEDIALGAAVSFVVALVFWPRRAVTLLRECTVDLYRTLGGAARQAESPLPAVHSSEQRAHAAFAQYLDDRRRIDTGDGSWSTLLGVAGLGRTGFRLLGVHRTFLRESPARAPLDAATVETGDTWDRLATALARRTPAEHPPPPASGVAQDTKAIVVDSVEAERDRVDAVLSVALWRDWLVELTSLFGDADDAVRHLAAPDERASPAPARAPRPGDRLR